MVNILIFGNQSAGINYLINNIITVDNTINIADFSNRDSVKIWKNGRLMVDGSVNFIPYTIVVVININDDAERLVNYWINKLCHYNKKVVFVYNIIGNYIINYQKVFNGLSSNSCIVNSYTNSPHDINRLLLLIR